MYIFARHPAAPPFYCTIPPIYCTFIVKKLLLCYTFSQDLRKEEITLENLIFLGYETIASFLGFLVGVAAVRAVCGPISYKPKYYMFLLAFGVYLAAVFHFTGAGTLYDGLLYGILPSSKQLNLIPVIGAFLNPLTPISGPLSLLQWLYTSLVGAVLNIILFIPFGFFLPVLWKKQPSFRQVAMLSLLFSLGIELSQLLNNRNTDVNDLILNTFGGAAGFWIFQKLCSHSRLCQRFFSLSSRSPSHPLILVAAAFFGRFFLYNEFGLAKAFYL